MDAEARCLGLIGGLGPGATVHYYRGLLKAHERRGRIPRILIAHADVTRARAFVDAGKVDALARYLAGFAQDLRRGGAAFTAMVAVTPHICANQFVRLSPLPLIDMVSTVADAIKVRGLKRVALLGTRSTIESRMFGRLGVDVVMPKPNEIEQINAIYLDVLYDRATVEKIDALRALAHTLIERDGAESVLLAGTDLSMVLSEDNAGFPTIDCADVHIEAITRQLLA